MPLESHLELHTYFIQTVGSASNIAQGKAEHYICHKTLIKSCIFSYKQSGSVLSVNPIVFHTNLTHLLNKQTGFFDKMYQ